MKKMIFFFILFTVFHAVALYKPWINIVLSPNCPKTAPFQYMEDHEFPEKRWFDGKENECLSCDSEDPFSFDYLPDQDIKEKMSRLCPNRIWEENSFGEVNNDGFFRKKCPPDKPVFSPYAHKCQSCQEMFLEQKKVLYNFSQEACRLCPNTSYYPKGGMTNCRFSDMSGQQPSKTENPAPRHKITQEDLIQQLKYSKKKLKYR